MLPPIKNAQLAQPLHKEEKQEEKQKDNKATHNSVTGQETTSPLSEFLNADEMSAIIPELDESLEVTDNAEQGVSDDVLNEAIETMEAAVTTIDKEELVAKLLEETLPQLNIEEEQLEVFAPVAKDGAAGNESAAKNLVEAVVETLTETPMATLVKTFVKTEDIAKLVSSKKLLFNPIGSTLLEKTVMLLKNGMAYTNLIRPPGEIEIPSSLESADPTAWTTWRQDEETGAIYLGSDDPAGETRLKGAEIDMSPLSIEDIVGTHTKTRTNIRGATQVTRWSDIAFNADGTFEYSLSKLSTTGGADTYWQESFQASFTHVSANIPAESDDGAENKTNSEPRTNMFGTFKLAEDGLSIELTYADGSTESRLIYKNNAYVHFGETSYKTRSKTDNLLEAWRNRALNQESNQLLNPAWLAVVADSAAAFNDNRAGLNHLILAPERRPGNGK